VTSRYLVRAALYAALYAVLTLAPGLNALAYGQVQFRVSEALMVFACVDPAAVPGLTLGTALGNLGSPMLLLRWSSMASAWPRFWPWRCSSRSGRAPCGSPPARPR